MKLCGFLPAMTHDDNVQAAYQICRFHRGKSAFKSKKQDKQIAIHTEMCIFACEKLTKQNLYGL